MNYVYFPSFADSTEMTTVGEDGKIACLVPYHYAGHLESVTEPVGGARAMRITQEITTLANSLPLSASSSVFIRCDEERVDVMKVRLPLCEQLLCVKG